jgi:hypothetical protein
MEISTVSGRSAATDGAGAAATSRTARRLARTDLSMTFPDDALP